MSIVKLNTVVLILIAIMVGVGYLLKLWWQRRHIRKLASEIPGPKAYPLIGNILDILAWTQEESFKKYVSLARKYTPTGRIWVGPYLIISVSDPCDLEILMNSEKCLGRGRAKNVVNKYPLGDGLIVIEGEQWRIHRKFILSSFQYRHFEYFIKVFNKNSKILVNRLIGRSNNRNTFDIYHYFTKFSFDSICETVLGIEMNAQENTSEKYINSADTVSGILTQMFFKPWLLNPIVIRLTSYHKKLTECTNYMNSFSNELFINKAREYREKINQQVSTSVTSDSSPNKDRPSLIDPMIHMIEHNECVLTKKEIIGEINWTISAGMETTATSLSLTMMLLGFHQDVQRKVIEELDAVFGDDVERSVSMEDLNNLKYTEQVIKESLRLYPVVPFVPRTSTEDIKITNFTLPKGCDLLFNISSLHRNPKIYPNPDEFDPENFSPERSKGRHPYSFLPFSGSLRKCVGYKYAMLQMKVVLATVLRHFTVHPACERKEIDRWAFSLTLKLVNGYNIRIVPRG